MSGTGYGVLVYVVYGGVAVALTVWLARILYRSGKEFLHDVFDGRHALADAVNRLLVVGFYMLNLGYALFTLRSEQDLAPFEAMQFLFNRLGRLLLTLGLIHFVNVSVFWRLRTSAEQRRMPPPVPPQIIVQPAAR